MELKRNGSHFSTIKISALGALTTLASLLFYQAILASYAVEIRNVEFLESIAYVVLVLVLTGLCLLLFGATGFLIHSSKNYDANFSRTVRVLSLALNDKRSRQAFVLASLIYGAFFAFVSSLFLYQPIGGFSQAYGVSVPSSLSVICCGSLGQMPQFIVYLTQQFAILIVPLNLVLLVVVSWLVGLNAAIATYTFKNRSSPVIDRWFGGLGAIVGLFTACPTCAGFFLLTLFGLTGAMTLALTLSSLQVLFVGIGLPMLLLTPIITARRIPKGWTTSCAPLADGDGTMRRGS